MRAWVLIPFDVYYYEVVRSPNPDDVGHTLSINVPRTINTYKVPVALYNRSVIGGRSAPACSSIPWATRALTR